MAGVVAHVGQPLDHGRDARQRPEFGGEAMGAGTLHQRGFDPGQLLALEAGFATRAPGRLQPRPAPRLPRVKPPVRRRHAHAQRASDRVLRQAAGEQPRRRQPPSFQRPEVPSTPACRGHASAWHRTR